MSHKFSVGQKVHLAHRRMEGAPHGQYEVRRLMPTSDRDSGDPVYRIKSTDETHERVAQESDLALSQNWAAD
jgi:hypothetical protein